MPFLSHVRVLRSATPTHQPQPQRCARCFISFLFLRRFLFRALSYSVTMCISILFSHT
ncbi:hypothetical protein ABB37_06880 [Leptomonas pyrrhocoris]|uniref:Uncharacterized protein n=1 Tax=Leptomonas pyrrhocoris TaxID=157538 RepID=A0A0M9FWG4_LEPPY|nr:hypothetical protein ABB37_06876 [Leptomonas pyrrhocoris]XP_015655926.1 hypothetical protein ABB37_06878 [Leptomonas pyrrhocoris]XP_015655928.1 hypothetical protein ABB37_06880 [Leptomonas pyrrhocoris]KPA77485.1 hypothetical protein ABB37_06876 [Leptomonas pyrrhocoris]KPA77487.1 hypothetical protein ABB37_06878 [Leptomonas pyrrhocoris]KPA77489.1 hypothetical protein ABB37_06880 [Leptomonas pyrrhocoris]|eukprot:XP_015655924.1 hypothetical protein ABB37_06876 [Leptomonas pyrrhocoris]